MSETADGHTPSGTEHESEVVGDLLNVDEVRGWLEKVGDARPPVEPDLHAIVDRAGQRVFRRRIGTGLALLGLIAPAAAFGPGVATSITARPTATTVLGEVEPVVVREGPGAALVSISECLLESGRNRANFGTCRYL